MDLGKSHIVIMWTVGPDEVAAGDALFQSHGKWMEGHSREGGTGMTAYRRTCLRAGWRRG